MICFYHSSDFDGICSAAIVNYSVGRSVQLFPINYNRKFPWEIINTSEDVVIVDFSLPPDDMLLLEKKARSFIWIDHHKSAIENSVGKYDHLKGLRDLRVAACELTWLFFVGPNVPEAVHYLSEYDVWRLDDEKTLLFQYGLRVERPEPIDAMWIKLFERNNYLFNRILDNGTTVLAYEKKQNEFYVKSCAFAIEFLGLRAIVCNRALSSSQLFDSIYDPNKYDIMITFSRNKYGTWNLSFYSTKKEIDCSKIASQFGGGGHAGAAGCQMKELPF